MILSNHCWAADWWSHDPTTNSLMIASNAVIIADWAQTRHIADSENFYEKNEILGPHPSTSDVNRFFLASLFMHNVIGAMLPDTYKKVYYGGQLSYRLRVVKNNAEIGIQFKF